MNNYLALVILGFSFAGAVSAQQSGDEAIRKAFEGCGDTRETANQGRTQFVISVSGWTGGCANGKRDGHGTLNYREESIQAAGSFATVKAQEGQFAAGRRIGLWCTAGYQRFARGNPVKMRIGPDFRSCRVYYGTNAGSNVYRKLSDGRWQVLVEEAWDMPSSPPTFVAAGGLEAESSRLLAEAMDGKADLKPLLVMQSPILDDLVRGSKIPYAASDAPVPLTDRRVGLVMSSQMIAELERFKRERQALIDAGSGFTGEAAAARARFIAASDPDRLLAAVVKTVRRYARAVQPFDDSLADLSKAGFDYALVLHWEYVTRLDLLGKYDGFPSGTDADVSAGRVPPLFGNTLSGFLISTDLKAVRMYTASVSAWPKGTASGDSAYLKELHERFDHAWGPSATYSDGATLYALGSALRRQNEQK